jgi:tetraacyldisaccharide 4'-kinase
MKGESSIPRPIASVLASLYGAVVLLRNRLYDAKVFRAHRSALPVISIGNLTVGGNGKTPLCHFLALQLQERGMHPVILSRGYGGSLKGPHRVTDADTPERVGDEPLLLSFVCGIPVYVSRSRVAGIQMIEQDKSGNIVILDDGFQHRALYRDVDILSSFVGTPAAIEEFVKGDLLPLGRFREDRDEGLSRATLMVLAERRCLGPGEILPPIDPSILRTIPPQVTIYRSFLESEGVRWLDDRGVVSPQKVVALAGIAQPDGFFESLKQGGFSLEATHSFADHHVFSVRDLEQIRAANPSLPLVCTEKDAIKVKHLVSPVCDKVAVFRTTLKVTPADSFMVSVIRELRRRSEDGL